MAASKTGSLRTFVILTYVLFWGLFAITGLTVYLEAPEIVQTVMKNVCAWASTFVILIWVKKFYPGESFIDVVKRQFPKTTFGNFAWPTLIQILIVFMATIVFFTLQGEPIKNISFIDPSILLPTILVFITSGPMGEELGWRGYALNEFQKKHSPLVSSLFIGLLWGFWHFPLWIISGFSGIDLLVYCASFMLGILSFSVFMTYFYNKKKNLGVAFWMHFLFNMLLQVVVIEDYKFILVISVLYLITSICIVLTKRKEMLFVNHGGDSSPILGKLG